MIEVQDRCYDIKNYQSSYEPFSLSIKYHTYMLISYNLVIEGTPERIRDNVEYYSVPPPVCLCTVTNQLCVKRT